MEIDRRLERLTERHEALTQGVDLFIANRSIQLEGTMNRPGNLAISHHVEAAS